MKKVVNKKKWNKIYTVSTEGPCNLSCLGCGSPRIYKERDLGKIITDIERGANEGYERIEIIGGEPTIHKNFFLLFSLAKKKYKFVNLTTNGIALSDKKFAEKTMELVDEVNFSLDGHNARIHEAWTLSPGSFKKTITGIKNCLEINSEKVSVTHLVWSGNYDKLRKLTELDVSLGIKKISFLNLQPIGRSKKDYKKLLVRLKDLKNFDKQFINLLGNFECVDMEDFPFCVFSDELLELEKDNVNIVDIAGQFFVDKNNKINAYDLFMVHDLGVGIDSTSDTQKKLNSIEKKLEKYRVHLIVCNRCRFNNKCNGVFDKYTEIFGISETSNELSDLINEK